MLKKQHFDLSISIVSFNTKDCLRECLLSIYMHTKDITFEIFVVDNASTDGSAIMLKKEFPKVHLLKNKKNIFFTKAHNQALRHAQGTYVLILNSDTQVHPKTLESAVRFLRKNPSIGALGIKHILPNGSIEQTCQKFTHPIHEFFHSNLIAKALFKPKMMDKVHYKSWDRKTSRYVDAVSDACLFAPRHVLEKIGFYDEHFLLFFTENDLCLRIKNAGYKIYYFAQASIMHVRGQSVQQLKSKKAYKIYEHDMLAYYRKYFGVLARLFLYLTSRVNRIYYLLQPFIAYIKQLKTTYDKT